MFMTALILVLLVSFLLGSIPWGVIVSKGIYHIDVREFGSGNIGATNSFRAMGPAGGLTVFALDFIKGVLAGLFAKGTISFLTQRILGGMTGGAMATVPGSVPVLYLLYGVCFLGCVSGHMFSPWLRFHGGKGISVAAGSLCIAFSVWGSLLLIAIWGVITLITKYVSVGSITATVLVPVFSCYFYTQVYPYPWTILLFLAGAAMVVWAHRGNIERLRNHTESRIAGFKRKA